MATRKAHNPTTFRTSNVWSGTTTEVSVNSGRKGVGVTLRYSHEAKAVNASLTVQQARDLAVDLIARADEIEGADTERQAKVEKTATAIRALGDGLDTLIGIVGVSERTHRHLVDLLDEVVDAIQEERA